MPKDTKTHSNDVQHSEEHLIDLTAPLPLRSKRTSRQQKKAHQKAVTSRLQANATLWDLPSELLIHILSFLKPSDVFKLLSGNKALRSFIQTEDTAISLAIISRRYRVLSKCFPRPVLLENVDPAAHPALLSEERQAILNIHKRPYQHIALPDQKAVCTCLTCMLAWNNLNLLIDFSYWQRHLNTGEPIPIIPRGKSPSWNRKLVAFNAGIVGKALRSYLWYTAILEKHLQSTVGSIRRHGNNKGNKRRRFRMSEDDVKAGSDAFMGRSGPPSTDFPWVRDNYYMLETYAPNRGWFSEEGGEGEWRYMPASQHERDVESVKAWTGRRKEERIREKGEKEMNMEKETVRIEEALGDGDVATTEEEAGTEKDERLRGDESKNEEKEVESVVGKSHSSVFG